jgi:hypothetical protein
MSAYFVEGLPFFINGVGGSSISGFGEIHSNSRFRYAEDYGALLVDASATRITFRFVNRDGRIIDQCVLVKNEMEQNPLVYRREMDQLRNITSDVTNHASNVGS